MTAWCRWRSSWPIAAGGSTRRRWPGRIINIHPALLPRHGGPGMYGRRVHEAVLADLQSLGFSSFDEYLESAEVVKTREQLFQGQAELVL